MNQTQPRATLGKLFALMGKAFCYLFLFLGWQTLVSMACTYAALYELSVGGKLPIDYRDGMLAAVLIALGLGVLILLIAAIVLKVRKIPLRRALGLSENVGSVPTALAAVGVTVGTLGVMALLGRMAWQLFVGMLYMMSMMPALMEGAEPDLMVVYDAVLAKTAEISAVSGILTLATLAVFFRLRGKKLREEVWLRPVRGNILGWGAGLAFCLYWTVTLVFAFVPAQWLESYEEASAGLNDQSLLMIIATVLIAPVVEEVIFRGLIYTRLQRGFHPLAAVVGAALLFGYCHGNFIWFCYAFALGLIFCQITRYTGSILPALLMHVVFNATNELVLLLSEWIPDMVFGADALLFGLGGALFFALRLRAAIREARADRPAAPVVSEEPPAVEAPAVETVEIRPAVSRPAPAMWDADSGPDHKFPPERR